MEWKAFLFSLSVIKGNIFRFFAPAIALGLTLILFHVSVAYFVIYKSVHYEAWSIFYNLIIFFVVTLVSYFLYESIYPDFKHYLLYSAWQFVHPEQVPMENNKKMIAQRRKISLYRFFLQTLSFALICFVTPFLILAESFYMFHFFSSIKYSMMILFASLVFIIPAIIGFCKYYFFDISLIDSFHKTQSTMSILLFKNKQWPRVLLYKVALTLSYFIVLLLFSILLVKLLKMEDFVLKIFDHIPEYGSKTILSPIFLLSFFFFPFFALKYSSSLIGHIIFLLILGIVTAFFFLVETLSTVYFYHHSKVKPFDMEERVK